jgi:hypothetical protein
LIRKIKLLFFGLAFIFLGIVVISLKFMLGDNGRLPLWPFDGIAAIAGGVFIIWWSWKVMNEPEQDGAESEDAEA